MTARRRILVFSTQFPHPVDRGDKNRLFYTLRLLSTFADVRLACLWRQWETRVPPSPKLEAVDVCALGVTAGLVMSTAAMALLSGRPQTMFRFGPPSVARFLRRQIEEFQPDVFWVYQLSAQSILGVAPGRRLVLDLVDSPSLYHLAARQASGLSLAARLSNSLQWRHAHFGRLALERSDAVLVSSARDRAHLTRLYGDLPRVHLFENCVPRSLLEHSWRPDLHRPPRLLFVGNLAYSPNDAGVRWFAREVLPRIRRKLPAEFLVCGARGGALQRDLGGVAGIRFLGFVEDLVALHLESSVLVVPVPLATGTQYKLLEGLALGMPVVASPQAARAGGFVHGRDLLVADTAEGFAQAVTAICEDPGLAASLSDRGRATISDALVWEGKVEFLRRIVNEARESMV